MADESSSGPQDLRLVRDTEFVRSHPGLPALVSEYCVQLAAEPLRWPLRKLLNAEFRYEICFLLIANHARWQRGGGSLPTLAAVKAAARSSPRQVADFVAALRRCGLLHAAAGVADRRTLILAPSAELVREIGRHPALTAAIYARLRHGVGFDVAAHDPEWTIRLVIGGTEASNGRGLAESRFGAVAAFAAHESGYLILVAVLQAHYAAFGAGERSTQHLTYFALSERFHVSQSHVANVVRQAREAGWFRLGRGGYILDVSHALVAEFEHFIAEQAAHFGRIAETIGLPGVSAAASATAGR